MKASWVLSALSISLSLFGVPSCGGKSGVDAGHSSAGGQGGESAGQGGAAGSGAGPSTHVTECEALCARTVDAGCLNDETSCLVACATVTGYPSCQSPIDAWLICAKDSAITCDASGNPSFAACDTELALVGACALLNTPPVAVASTCADYCAQVDEAGCTAVSQLGDCSQACGISGTVVPNCQSSFVAFTQCEADAGVTCDSSGAPIVTGCDSEKTLYAACVMVEMGEGILNGSGGAGGVGASN